MKNLSKAEEIELIEKLAAGGGYFTEYFGDTAMRMCENIRNDFPIEYETKMSRAEDRIEQLEDFVKGYEAKVNELTDNLNSAWTDTTKCQDTLSKILHNLVANEDMEVVTDPYSHFTFTEIVKAKKELEIRLTSQELNELFEKAGI